MGQNSINLSFLHFSHTIEHDGKSTRPEEITMKKKVIFTKFDGFTLKPLLSAINFGWENQVAVFYGTSILNVVLHNRWIHEACLLCSILKQNICGPS